MAIDMPPAPTTGDIYLASNGINYQWDGDKWIVYVDPSLGGQVWERDIPDTSLNPVAAGDDVKLKNAGGTTTITLSSNGSVSALEYDIDSLTTLP